MGNGLTREEALVEMKYRAELLRDAAERSTSITLLMQMELSLLDAEAALLRANAILARGAL